MTRSGFLTPQSTDRGAPASSGYCPSETALRLQSKPSRERSAIKMFWRTNMGQTEKMTMLLPGDQGVCACRAGASNNGAPITSSRVGISVNRLRVWPAATWTPDAVSGQRCQIHRRREQRRVGRDGPSRKISVAKGSFAQPQRGGFTASEQCPNLQVALRTASSNTCRTRSSLGLVPKGRRGP